MKNKKLRIGIDIDEVVVEYVKHYLKFCEVNLERRFLFEEISQFNLWKVLEISREEAFDMAKKFNEENLFLGLNFVEGAKEAIKNLSNHNELFFITSRPPHIKEKTVRFFNGHFSEVDLEIIFSEKLNGNEKSKAQVCNELGIQIMIEDRRKYALDCAENGTKVLLMDKPWNQNCEHENIIRVKNWKEILERLKNG